MFTGRLRHLALLVSAGLGISFAVTVGGTAVAAPLAAAPQAAAPQAAASPAASAGSLAPAGPGSYVSLPPTRLLDTRIGTGAPMAAVAGHASVDLAVTGRGGVPSTGVGAVVLTVTATQPTATGFITAYASGGALPRSSNLNFVSGRTVANLVVSTVGTGGAVALYNGSSGTVQLVADVSGYFVAGAPKAAGAFGSLTTTRLLDTRSGKGAVAGAVRSGGVVHLAVSGQGGVPTTNVTAVVLTVTATAPTANGYLTVYKGSSKRPASSTLNFQAGQTVANLAIARVGTDGTVSLYNGSSGTTQMVADVSGYITGNTPTTTGTFALLGPTRLLDTRAGLGAPKAPVAAGATIHLTVAGQQGVPTAGVAAVVLNLTTTSPTKAGYITAYADGAVRPTVSNLTFIASSTVANTVVVPVGPDGGVALYNGSGGTTALIADVAGYVTRSSVVWQAPRQPDPFQGGFSSVSCTTGPVCVAGGAGGVVYVQSGGSWTGPTVLGSQGNSVDSISCVSSTFCAAALQLGSNKAEPLTYNGTTWTVWPAVTGGIGSISCVSATFCVGLTGGGTGQYFTFNGTAWSPAAAAAQPLGSSVSCTSTTQCVSVRKNSYQTFNGTAWSASVVIDPATGAALESVSCPSDTFCVAVDNAGNYLQYDGTVWTAPASTGAGAFSTDASVSCSSASFCAAVTASGNAVEFDGTSWGAPSAIDTNSVTAVSCSSDGACVAVDSLGDAVTYAASAWGNPVVVDPPLGIPSSVSCPSAQSCYAVDHSGGYFHYTAGGWKSAQAINAAATDESAVSCPSTSFCMAVGAGGQSFALNGSTWSGPIAVGADRLTSVSCPSATLCLAVGDGAGNVYTYNGTAWKPAHSIDSAALTAVSCASASLCVAVDNAGRAVSSTDATTWSSPTAVSGAKPLAVVSCAQTAFCMAIDTTGTGYAYNGTVWKTTSAGLGAPSGLSCADDGTCVATSTLTAVNWDGRSWGQPTVIAGAVNQLSSVSCLPGFCAAVDANGHGFIGQ